MINYATELAMICVMPLNNFYAKTSFYTKAIVENITYCINIEILFTKKYFNLQRSNKGDISHTGFILLLLKSF